MAEKTKEKWILRIFILFTLVIGFIASIKLISGRDFQYLVTPMASLSLGVIVLIQLGWKHFRELFDTKFKYADVVSGILAVFGILSMLVGFAGLAGWTIPYVTQLAGWVMLITSVLLIPQLFLPR